MSFTISIKAHQPLTGTYVVRSLIDVHNGYRKDGKANGFIQDQKTQRSSFGILFSLNSEENYRTLQANLHSYERFSALQSFEYSIVPKKIGADKFCLLKLQTHQPPIDLFEPTYLEEFQEKYRSEGHTKEQDSGNHLLWLPNLFGGIKSDFWIMENTLGKEFWLAKSIQERPNLHESKEEYKELKLLPPRSLQGLNSLLFPVGAISKYFMEDPEGIAYRMNHKQYYPSFDQMIIDTIQQYGFDRGFQILTSPEFPVTHTSTIVFSTEEGTRIAHLHHEKAGSPQRHAVDQSGNSFYITGTETPLRFGEIWKNGLEHQNWKPIEGVAIETIRESAHKGIERKGW